MFVNVFVEEAVVTVLSIANVIVSPEIVEVIPVPPAIVNVSDPKLIVVVVDESSAIVKRPLTEVKESAPEPFVVNTWPFVPSVPGKVNVTSEATLFGALSAIKLVPLLVPSLNLIVPPVDTLLPINNSSIALFESTSNADEAVKVPGTWSVKLVKYLPPMTSILAATPSVSVPVPTKSLSPKLPWVPVPNVYASSPWASAEGADVPDDLLIWIIVDIKNFS